MENKEHLSPEVIYELVADVGFRKHFHSRLVNVCVLLPILSFSAIPN